MLVAKAPPCGAHAHSDLTHVDEDLQVLEMAHDEGTVGPGAAGRDLEGIETGLVGKLDASVSGDEVSEGTGGSGVLKISSKIKTLTQTTDGHWWMFLPLDVSWRALEMNSTSGNE